jgi:hypothetical protein
MSLEEAIRLNNEGVSFLITGKDCMATASFSKSLNAVKMLLQKKQQKIQDGHQASYSHQASSVCEHFLLHSTTQLPCFQGNEDNYILQNAITLKAVNFSSGVDETTMNLYSACAIFNVALLHHRLGMTGNLTGLRKAEHMYRLSAKLLQQETKAGTSNGTALLVRLAALNNLSQIQFEQGSFREARQGIQVLSFLVHSAQNWSSALFSIQEWNCLLSNIMMLVNTPSNAAPAA